MTTEWVDALTETLNAHEGFASSIANTELALQFEVPDAPEGTESAYHLKIADGKVRCGAGVLDDADATISNDYETAVAISKGDLNTQMAFMTGKIKVAGNMAKLMMNQAMLGQFAAASADLEVEY